jgi:hypothetical protein
LVVLVIGVPAYRVTAGPTHSVASFCKVYRAEKERYIKQTERPVSNAGDALNAAGTILSVPELFDRLNKVAPDDIEPDIANIRDSLRAAREQAGANAGDPLTGMASSLVAGMAAGPSWERVSKYVDANCTTPEERARREAAANQATLKSADDALTSALADLAKEVKDEEDYPKGDPLDIETGYASPSLNEAWKTLQADFAKAKQDAAAHPHPEPGLCLLSDVKSMGTVQGDYDQLEGARDWAPGGTAAAGWVPHDQLISGAADKAEEALSAFGDALAKAPAATAANTVDAATQNISEARDVAASFKAKMEDASARADHIKQQADALLAEAEQAHLLPDHC